MKAKFAIGDVVWRAQANQTEKWLTCPDCFGKKSLRVILGDGTEHTIDCDGCTNGSLGARGVVLTYEFAGSAVRSEITGVRIDPYSGLMKYDCNQHWVAEEVDLFTGEAYAMARAAELVADHEAEEKRAFGRKMQANRNWAWHVTYHRDQVRKAQHNLVYHTAKLNVAKLKVKGATE